MWNFVNTLANKLSIKNDESYAQVVTWLRTRLSFEIIRSSILCVRGSRVPFRKRQTLETEVAEDFTLSNHSSDMHL
jgi:hypothetical protein